MTELKCWICRRRLDEVRQEINNFEQDEIYKKGLFYEMLDSHLDKENKDFKAVQITQENPYKMPLCTVCEYLIIDLTINNIEENPSVTLTTFVEMIKGIIENKIDKIKLVFDE